MAGYRAGATERGNQTLALVLSHPLSQRQSLLGKLLSGALLMSVLMLFVLGISAPQIGDTLDPDNQVAGGVFSQLSIDKAEQSQIMHLFATFDTVRNAVETASLTKHYQRLNFALLGIEATFLDKSLWAVLQDNVLNILWLVLSVTGIAGILLIRDIDFNRLTRD